MLKAIQSIIFTLSELRIEVIVPEGRAEVLRDM
jgi:hypothetical protein